MYVNKGRCESAIFIHFHYVSIFTIKDLKYLFYLKKTFKKQLNG